jgi:hypothetical protein
VIGCSSWAEVRRLHFVERRSQREIHRLTGLHRDTARRPLAVQVRSTLIASAWAYVLVHDGGDLQAARRSLVSSSMTSIAHT